MYCCDLEMTIEEAEPQEIDVIEIEEHRFEQGKLWFGKFKPYV